MPGEGSCQTEPGLAVTGRADPALERNAVTALERIGRYRIVERIGGGGMGEVYAAEDPELERQVALKLLRSDRVSHRSRRRILFEARAMAKISHPNVVAVHEVGEDDGRVFIAMELVAGVDLDAWAKAERRSWRDVLDVYLQAGAGLAAAHDASLVHRDFKPHNAVLGKDGRVRVLDFGLVGAHDHTLDEENSGDHDPTDMVRSRLTESGVLLGSPAYMSPEQYDHRPATAASDQFSFCVSLHEALYGRRPFEADSVPALATKIILGTPDLGTDPAVPQWIRECLRRGLESEPRRRWPSMDALLAALRHDPRRRRRLVILGSAVLTGAVAVSAWQLVDHRGRVAECDRRGERLAERWDADRVDSVGAAMTAVDRPHASATWDRTRALLDDYTAQWGELARGVCQSQRKLDSNVQLAPEHLTGAMQCLDHAETRFEALVAALDDADAATVDQAVQAAGQLPWLPSCIDPAWLRHLPPQPWNRDPALAERVEQQLATAQSQAATGQHSQAQATAVEALALAIRLDDEPTRARAEFIYGNVLSLRGRYEESTERFERAFFRADASGYDMLAVRVASTLAFEHAYRGQRHEDALLWQELAEARLARLGLDGSVAEADVLQSRSSVERNQGHFHASRDAAHRSLQILERNLGPEHPSLLGMLNILGQEYNAAGEAQEALATAERALRISRSRYGPNHQRTSISLMGIAGVHLAEANFEEAIPLLQEAIRIEVAWSGPNHVNVATGLNNLGIAQEMTGQYELAKTTFGRALAIWEKAFGPEHPDVALVLTSVASIEDRLDNRDAALAANERALSIYEKTLGPRHPQVATALIQAGSQHRKSGAYETAIAYYTRAYGILVDALGEDHDFVATPLAGLGAVHRDRGDAEKSLLFFEKSLAVRVSASANPIDMAEAKFDVAQALVRVGKDPARARELAESAQALLADHPAEDRLARDVAAFLAEQH